MERLRQFTNPVYGILLVILVVFFTTAFNWGEDTIIYALVGSVLCIMLIQMVLGAAQVHVKRALAGQHSAVDFLVAPQGFRRNRAMESAEERARLSVARRLPSLPMPGDERKEEGREEQGNVDAARRESGKDQVREVLLDEGIVDGQDFINLSRQYQFHLNELLSQRGMLVGTSGSGKSFTTALILEELFTKRVPLIVFDTEGEYSRLPEWAGHGQVFTQENLREADGLTFGRRVVAGHHQVIINLASYEDINEAAGLMGSIVKGVIEWEESLPNEERVAIMTFLTEAHKWFPQYVQESQLKPEVYQMMQVMFLVTMVRRGRKRGVGFVFDSQKLSEVDKRLIQTDWRLCLRQTEDRSMERYNRWGITNEEAMNLHDGEGFLFSKRVNKLRIQVNRRQSPDDSQSPGIESIRRHRPESLSPSRNQAGTTTTRAEPRGVPVPMRKLPRSPEEETWPLSETSEFVFQEYVTGSRPSRPAEEMGSGRVKENVDEREEEEPVEEIPSQFELAVDAYGEGATSISKLAAKLNISLWEARKLMPKVEEAWEKRCADTVCVRTHTRNSRRN